MINVPVKKWLLAVGLAFGGATSICDANEKSAQSEQTSIQLEEVFRIENKVPVKSVDFSPDGTLLAAALFSLENNPDTVKLWDVTTGKEVEI
jgi:WD40 repeat protein